MTSDSPAHVVILGASNVTLGFPRIVSHVRRMFPAGVQILAAHGHGRSFGKTSRVGFRSLPGIRESGLWQALRDLRAGGETPPLYAVLTDIGNDLVFGVTPERLAGWLVECLTQLRSLDARITIGRLPLDSLSRLGRWRFNATRTLFFPGTGLTYERMHEYAPQLDELVMQAAIAHSSQTFIPRSEWYGFDPIHIRRRHRAAAWGEILGSWLETQATQATQATAPGLGDSYRYWSRRPATRTMFGIPRTAPQPGWKWPDGSALWLF
jgi:hypothetical protein